MPRLHIVDEAIADVRSLCDEKNEATMDNLEDILPSLNRAQIFAFDILSKHYEEPLLNYVEFDVTGDVQEIDMPENIFEDRIVKVEFQHAGYYYACKNISFRDVSLYESPMAVNAPAYYCIFGRTIRFYPKPTGVYTCRLWSIREPDELVTSQGRVSSLNIANNFVVVEDLGSDLTSEQDSLNSFVNIIDGQTGAVKQSLQISSIVGSRITFRTTPSRTAVINRSISATLSDEIMPDDYVCVIKGTCVPFFSYPIYNFIVQYAVNEMNRKLKNENVQTDDMLFDKFARQVERTWAGRELSIRVQKKSQHWLPRSIRRKSR